MNKFKSILIEGLYNDRNVRLLMEGDVLIIVGHNGTGKSTAISILFFCLTAQWDRLSTYKFSSITIEFEDRKFRFSLPEVSALALLSNTRTRNAVAHGYFEADPERQWDLFYHNAILDSRAIREAPDLSSKQLRRSFDIARTYEKYINSGDLPTVLYLPTYRRIEKELQEIFRSNERSTKEAERLIKRVTSYAANHIELVSFGMEDVKALINDELEDVRRIANARLNDLTGSYLRDIVDRKAEKFEASMISRLRREEIDSALKIVDANSLPEAAKNTIRDTIIGVQEGRVPDHFDQLLANYFSKLYSTYQQIRERESRINLFVETCNKYFYGGKEFSYDEPTHELTLSGINTPDLDLSLLSSGEKQIVSIFAHLLLSSKQDFFVIIDEPEMSLSVRWQEIFLPDMMSTGRISKLVAVTHSPFIFKNSMTQFTSDFSNFVQYVG